MQKYFLTDQLNLTLRLLQKAWLLPMIAGLLLSGCTRHSIASNPSNLFSKQHIITKSSLHSTKTHTVPHSSLTQFEVQGKLGFSDGKKGGSANFMWIEDGKHFDIRLYGPFGAGAIWIQGMNGEVFLTDGEGKTFSGKTPETILKKVTAWDIPVSGLRFWLKGMPSPHSSINQVVYLKTAQQQIDRPLHPLLESFNQDGWSISYQGYRQVKNHWVPKALILQRGKLRLKVIFKLWTL